MIPSNNTDALARVYAAGIAAAVEIGKSGRDADGAVIAQACVRDFVTLINTLDDEERDQVGATGA